MTGLENFIELRPECIHIGVVRLLVNDGIHSFFPEYDLSGKSIVINHTKTYVGRFVLYHMVYVSNLCNSVCKRSSHLNQYILLHLHVIDHPSLPIIVQYLSTFWNVLIGKQI